MAKTKILTCADCIHYMNFRSGDQPLDKSGTSIGVMGEKCKLLNHWFVGPEAYAVECKFHVVKGQPTELLEGYKDFQADIEAINEGVREARGELNRINLKVRDLEQTPVPTLKQIKQEPQTVYNYHIAGDYNE